MNQADAATLAAIVQEPGHQEIGVRRAGRSQVRDHVEAVAWSATAMRRRERPAPRQPAAQRRPLIGATRAWRYFEALRIWDDHQLCANVRD